MAENQGEIIDFHLGAFNTELAIAYGYDTNETPRTPAVRLLTEHRAFNSFEEAEAHRIGLNDKRLRRLGLTAAQLAELEFDRRTSPELDIAVHALARITREGASV